MSARNNIKGFTLLEVLLTMSLTGLLILIGGNVFFYFQKVQIGEVKKIADQNHVLLLDLRLQKDFLSTYFARKEGNRLHLEDLKHKEITSYTFSESEVYRYGQKVDTFLVVSSPECLIDSSGIVKIRIGSLDLTYKSLPFSRVDDSDIENPKTFSQ
ncbi:MAG: prepilin-type N-terminal cleavage/methylation domain-containing protein [Bacteroidia bacterium]